MISKVKEYYDNNFEQEWKRLDDPYARIEFFSTLYMIKKYFPKEGHVYDIASGPGRYAIELLKRGYHVSLMDLSDNNIALAKSKIESFGLMANKYVCGDARYLSVEKSESYDAILLMGAMYHIQSRDERIDVLKECKRLLKEDGIIIISYINSIGLLRTGVSEFASDFEDINGIYRLFGSDKYDYNESFTNTYFITPEEAKDEINQSGLNLVSYAGAESFLSGLGEQMTKHYIENRKVYLNLLKVATEKCEESKFRDSTEHLIMVCKK